ncbi:hypothetical protein EC991_005256 [Linnemannia zychae]|nr:hypothetical protein EC991_005256 [Linnemannia zychae]
MTNDTQVQSIAYIDPDTYINTYEEVEDPDFPDVPMYDDNGAAVIDLGQLPDLKASEQVLRSKGLDVHEDSLIPFNPHVDSQLAGASRAFGDLAKVIVAANTTAPISAPTFVPSARVASAAFASAMVAPKGIVQAGKPAPAPPKAAPAPVPAPAPVAKPTPVTTPDLVRLGPENRVAAKLALGSVVLLETMPCEITSLELVKGTVTARGVNIFTLQAYRGSWKSGDVVPLLNVLETKYTLINVNGKTLNLKGSDSLVTSIPCDDDGLKAKINAAVGLKKTVQVFVMSTMGIAKVNTIKVL